MSEAMLLGMPFHNPLRPFLPIFRTAVAGALLFSLLVASNASQSGDGTTSAEAPTIRRILARAAQAENEPHNNEMQAFAARLYCIAARLGSLEAQYRLARMIFEGRGMGKNIATAETLLSIAAGNGHANASAMLPLTSHQLESVPACIESPESAIDVEHGSAGDNRERSPR